MTKGIKGIAKLAGVSTTTVSHVINNTRFVSEELRSRVQDAMRQLHYRPNRMARGFRRKQSYTIGVILPDVTNPYFAEVARGVEDACFEKHYSAIICNADSNPSLEAHYLDMLSEKQMDGIILVNVGDYGQRFPENIFQDIPFAMLDREMPGLPADSVQVNNHFGGRLAAEYLFRQGHRDVLCIGGTPKVYPSWDRILGFTEYMGEQGIPVSSDRVLAGDFQAESGYQLTLRALEDGVKATAIFAANDLMAFGVIRAVAQMGLRIPADVSVVGFDDIKLSALFNPPLTTVRQPRLKMGEAAVALLLERMTNRNLKARRIMLPLELVERQTSGPVRKDR